MNLKTVFNQKLLRAKTKAILNKEDDTFCKSLADILMVEADGGDSPIEVIREAINETCDTARKAAIEREIKSLRLKKLEI